MSLLMIAWANIRRKKGVALSMGILILLSVAMFHVGLTLLTGIHHFYDKENERLMGAHYVVRFLGNECKDEYLEYFQQDSRVEQAEEEQIVIMNMASFLDGGAISANFINLDAKRNISGFQITDHIKVPEEDAVYIPAFMKEMGYEPGDILKLKFNKQIYSFQVAGYTQSTWFHSSVSSLVNFYMPKKAFDKLFLEIGGGSLLSIRVKDLSDVETIRQDFKDQTDVKIEAISLESKVMDFSINEMRNGSTMVVTLLSAVLFVFSFLIVLVAVIVMKFRIANHIEEQMRNIGALKAMGYTGKQIKWSIDIEFLLIGVGGTILGIFASYGILWGLGGLITNSVGVSWSGENSAVTSIVSSFIILLIVMLTANLSAGKAAKLHPVRALRGGLSTHNFKKSHFSFERTKGSLSLILGLKNIAFQTKTYLMIGLIFAGVTFASGFAVVTFCNLALDDSLVLQMTGYEISDITVYKASHTDFDELVKDLKKVEGVRKTSVYEVESAEVENELLTCYVSDDYDSLEMVKAYEGTLPKYDNEIAVTGVLAKSWGKKIGDTVTVKKDGASLEYVICGLGQTMNNFGRQCYMSQRGIKKILPFYEKSSVQVYLDENLDVNSFITKLEQTFQVISPSYEVTEQDEKIEARKRAEEKISNILSMYGADSVQYALMEDGQIVFSGDTGSYQIQRIENNRELFISNVNSISMAVTLMSIMILIGTMMMVALVLYMVIKSMVVKQKKEFGIYKAIGYTDRQLMRLIAVSFLPSSVGGTFVGIVSSIFAVNPLAGILFEKLGASQLEFVINPFFMLCVSVGIVLFSFFISMLVAGKIKGITVCGLLTEE